MNSTSAWIIAPQVVRMVPLIYPSRPPTSMAQSMAPTCPRGSISETATTLHREMMPTTERSIKPPMMTNDMPNATNGSGQSWRSTFVRLEALANFGSTMAVTTIRSTMTMSTRLWVMTLATDLFFLMDSSDIAASSPLNRWPCP